MGLISSGVSLRAVSHHLGSLVYCHGLQNSVEKASEIERQQQTAKDAAYIFLYCFNPLANLLEPLCLTHLAASSFSDKTKKN
jgi:hypothetical protein